MWPTSFVGGQSLRRALQVKPGVGRTREGGREVKVMVSILVASFLAAQSASAPRPPGDEWPQSVDAAVEKLRARLDAKTLEWILRSPRDQVVVDLHLPFGTGVRNEFGLWRGNDALLSSCGVKHPEECSGVIFEALWRKVRSFADSTEVARLDCQFAIADWLKVRYKGFYKLRIGEVVESLQRQLTDQLPEIRSRLPKGCASKVTFRVNGQPRLDCWVRAETSEDGRDPVSLSRFFAWFAWRNAFVVTHRPPTIDLDFEQVCTWPEYPKWFQSRGGSR